MGNRGSLKCESCDAWIVLSKCRSFGEENSLDFSPKRRIGDSSCTVQPSVDFAFLDAIFKRYVPEYQHCHLRSYLSGKLSLEETQYRTGIKSTSLDEV
jgi:hypothetical protein